MKINKKAQVNPSNQIFAYIIIGLLVFVGAVLLLYLLSQILFVVGIVVAIVGLIIIIAGAYSQEEKLVFLGFILIFIGVVMLFIGLAGINFFENNPTGQNALNTANTVVNQSRNLYSTMVNPLGK